MFLEGVLEGAVAGVPLTYTLLSHHRGEQWQGQVLPVLAAVSSAGSQRHLPHTRSGLQMASLGGGTSRAFWKQSFTL